MKRRQATARAPLPDSSHPPYFNPVNYNKDDPTEFDANYQTLMPVANSIKKRSGTVFSAPGAPAPVPTRSSTSSSSTSISYRSSLDSFLSLSSSSSETAFYEGDDELDGQTDVDEPPNEAETETKDGEYSYCLLSALPMRSFAPGPKSMDAPWPYTFKEGDIALAKGGNGTWRRVMVLDGGFVSSINLPGDEDESPGLRALAYTAQWADAFGQTFRGTFCPTRGDIKPDDAHVRRLLAQERARE